MGRLATGLVCAGALGFLATFVGAAGCAGSGDADPGVIPDTNTNPTDPNDPSNGSTKLGSGNTSSSSSSSGGAGQGDAGTIPPLPHKDGGTTPPVDAGPPPPPAPVVNDPCPTRDQSVTVACLNCGTQSTLCELKPDGSLGWSVYSDCKGMHGECEAGKTDTQDCNNCGTRPVTCSAQCTWVAGACSAAANTGCVPGAWDITNTGCNSTSDGQYRVRSCSNTCTYNPYSGCEAPPTTVEVGPTVGSVSSTIAVMGGSLPKMAAYSCPASSISSMLTAYAYIQVHNPLAKDVVVDIYNSAAPSGTITDTALAAYNSDVAPATAADRKACLSASTSGTSSLTGSFDLASLDVSNGKKVTIAAGGVVTVYIGAEDNHANSVGPVKLNVKTETIAP